MKARAKLAADIGGTFTDIVLENGPQRWSGKVLTTTHAPELGVIEGIRYTETDAFCVGVQWHAEWRFEDNALSNGLWRAFGNACRDRAAARSGRKIAAE